MTNNLRQINAALIISHGSRTSQSHEEVIRLGETLCQRSGWPIVETAFLEVDQPNISAAVKTCVEKGATHVVVLLNFLNSGRHVLEDIPHAMDRVKKQFPNTTFEISPLVGSHPAILDILMDYLKSQTTKTQNV